MARGFKVADAYVELTIDKDELRRGAAAIPGEVGPQLDRAGTDMGKRLGKSLGDESTRQGEDAGGKLALGMRMSLIRNSPLIVAAIGAALAAGAPAMLTAATGLFAGIGIVAAAQSEKVQRAWLGTWQTIRDGAISDARPIEGVLVGLAGRVGEAFESLRPAMRGIFADVAPQIDVFARGMLGLVNNVMPGFQRAIANSMPVTEGFAAFLEKTGTGLSDFFDRITAHAPAAGAVWSSLGDTMAELLPLLGELLGQGAELAATVLPLLSGALGVVLDVVSALGPALPLVTAGFAAWKIVGTISPLLDRAAQSLALAAANGGMFAGTAGKMSGAMAGLSSAAIPLAAGIAAWAGIFQYSQSQIRNWTAALNEGGDAARQAQEDMSGFDDNMGKVGTVLDQSAAKFNIFTASTSWAFSLLKDDTDEAREAHEAYLASLTPTEAAARGVAIAEEALARAIEEHGARSNEARTAQQNLDAANATAAGVADRLAVAIRGVTEAMVAQADQARSEVDAGFAYERSLNAVEDAYASLLTAMQEHGVASEEAQRATLDYNVALSAQVDAAKAASESELPAALDEQQKAMIGNKAALDELNGLIAAGVQLPPSMEEYRQSLERITGEADGARLMQAQMAASVAELGYAVTSLPDGKAIRIEGVEPEKLTPIRDGLRDLGFDVITLPDGKTVEVRAITEEAKGNVANISELLTSLGLQVAQPQVALDPNPVIAGAAAAGGAVAFLDQSQANPLADLADDPLIGAYLNDMGLLGNLAIQSPAPVADLIDDPLIQAQLNDLGLLGNLNGQTPTPSAFLNDGSLNGTAQGVLGTLGTIAGQRPTPVAGLLDFASGPLAGIKRWLDSLYNKTITVTTVEQRIAGGATVNSLGLAGGGNIGKAVRGFADGGAPRRQSNGKLIGPGGPLDDLIPAITNLGEHIRVANSEWIIPGSVGDRQGDRRMSALVAGQADIVPRRFEAGGPIDERRRSALSDQRPVAIYISGTFDLASSRDLRRAATVIHSELKQIERSLS